MGSGWVMTYFRSALLERCPLDERLLEVELVRVAKDIEDLDDRAQPPLEGHPLEGVRRGLALDGGAALAGWLATRPRAVIS